MINKISARHVDAGSHHGAGSASSSARWQDRPGPRVADPLALANDAADDFLSIGERGYMLDKQQWIARNGDFRFISVDTSETDVRRYDRTAIVRSVQHTRATWLGTPMALTVRVSHVWIRQADGWKLAAVRFSSLDAG